MDVRRRIDILVEWALSNGAYLHPSVEIYPDKATGLSFRVKPDSPTPIAPYEQIVKLPTSLTLSYLTAISQAEEATPSSSLSKPFLAKASPHVVGRFFLINEFLKGEASFWWPYIQALPQPSEFEAWALPPFWPDDEAELLDGTNVEVGIEKIRNDVKKEYKAARDLLLQGDGQSVLAKALSEELYQWTYCIFSSRSFRPSLVLSETQKTQLPPGVSIDNFSVLLPLFDIGNHDMTLDVAWDLVPETSSCELKVGREFAPGDQVFNNYSMKTNAELLLGYGFLIEPDEELHNDYTHVRKRANTMAASDEYLISLRPLDHPSSLLGQSRQTGVALSKDVKVLGSFQHVPPDMVWDIFCTLASPEQLDDLIPLDYAQTSGLKNGDAADLAERHRQEKFFSGQVTGDCVLFLQQTIAIIQHKVLQELERLNETDVEVVGGDLTGNQQLAMRYRERCRAVLENTLEAMTSDDVLMAHEDEDEDGQ